MEGAEEMTKLMVAVAVAITLAALAVMGYAWASLSDVEISTAGYVALAAGAGLTFAVGAGLMFLIFYSNRAGFDERSQMSVSNREEGHHTAE
jgi:hypothetical protein